MKVRGGGAEMERDQAEHRVNYFHVRAIFSYADYVGKETQVLDNGVHICQETGAAIFAAC